MMIANFKIDNCSGYLRLVPSNGESGWPDQVCISYSHRGCHFHNYRRYENNHIVWVHLDNDQLPKGLIDICDRLFKQKAFW